MARAVALFSGGLDSTLAILTILKQGIEVKAIKFLTPFDIVISQIPPYPPFLKGGGGGIINFHHSLCLSNKEMNVAQRFGFDIEICHLADKFIEIVKNPKFGYGKNMNPCIDCRILMLKEAKAVMNMIGADFIITGEVLGQRPMSQRRDSFYLIDREAGVIDYVLRPLSAKLLKITFPEAKGIINREMLYGFSGRSRKPQMALAEELGLTDYPAPAGGCLLTEPNYAHRLKDLLTYNSAPGIRDINLLKIGRHFRFSPSCKIIVGRNKGENDIIGFLIMNGDCLLKVESHGSPTTFVTGDITDEAIKVAASLCARYSDAKNLSFVDVSVYKNGRTFNMQVSPADESLLENYRIELSGEKRSRIEPIDDSCR
jgi:tRNA-specific 2-thiouridylase